MSVKDIKAGDRIRLGRMTDDPDPVPAGTEGTVIDTTDLHFRDMPQIQLTVKWDNGRSLSCVCPPDIVEKIV